jgi:DNA-binding ferritin-like protein (Dps family)
MSKIIGKIYGVRDEKKAWREAFRRAKKLPRDYRDAFDAIKKYIFGTSGIMDAGTEMWTRIIDLLEEAAADGKSVREVVGDDVASFADEMVRGYATWQDKQRAKLNKKIAK